MKLLIHALLTLTFLSLSSPLSAYPEIPFCPAGGAPGWMNYIDYKRNQNRWQANRYPAYMPATTYTNYYYPLYNTAPVNNRGFATSFNHTPDRYSAPKFPGNPHNNQANYYRNITTPVIYHSR